MVKIKLFILGNIRYCINYERLFKWHSSFFSISGPNTLQILPETDMPLWTYSDEKINTVLKEDRNFDIVLGVINSRIEDNYYMRRIADNKVILSLYETLEVLNKLELSVEDFILKNIYEIVLIHLKCGNIPETAYQIAHEDFRSCLFDLNYDKMDIYHSLHKPQLCDACYAYFLETVPKEDVDNVLNELKRIKKPLFISMKEWIKKHPIISLVLAFTTAILANFVTEWIKVILRWMINL